jgi:magnesium transporter
MDDLLTSSHNSSEELYRLSDLLKRPVWLGDKKIGRVTDLVIEDKDIVAEVSHVCVCRPFGQSPFYVPWMSVLSLTAHAVSLDPGLDTRSLEQAPAGAVLLRDYIVDKRVLDVSGREVQIVYDVILALKTGRLFVISVDLSRSALLRRLGLNRVAKIIYGDTRQPAVAWNLVEHLPEELGSFKGDLRIKILREELAKLPPFDAARILEELSHDQRLVILHGLEIETASDTLEEIDPTVQRGLIAAMPKEYTAGLISHMTPGQAADVLSVLPSAEARVILGLLGQHRLARKVRQLLDQQEAEIANFLTESYLKFLPDCTVGQARQAYQQIVTLKASNAYAYVADKEGKLLGIVTAAELLQARDDTLLQNIMNRTVVTLAPEQSLQEASKMFARYRFRALPVTDRSGKLLGVVPYRDVMNLKHRYVEATRLSRKHTRA